MAEFISVFELTKKFSVKDTRYVTEIEKIYTKAINKIEDLEEEIDRYRKEVVELRGKAHLSCPGCGDDCIGWVVEGSPCSDKW